MATGLHQAGQPIPAPIQAKASLDPGSNVTCVAANILQRLGLSSSGQTTTQSIQGTAFVNLFVVSLSLLGPTGVVLTESDLQVMELSQPLSGIEVLVGRDILPGCFLIVDGPQRSVTLAT